MKRPDMKCCPACGSKLHKLISGFLFCIDCGYHFGSGGLGKEYPNRDGTHQKLGADEQNRAPKMTRHGRYSFKKEI